MAGAQEALDHFGEFITVNLRDAAIDFTDQLLAGKWRSPGILKLQEQLASLPPESRALVRRTVIEAIDTGFHDFLFKLQEQADFENRIRVSVDGHDVIAASDGIHGEALGEDGWYSRFSSFGEASDDE